MSTASEADNMDSEMRCARVWRSVIEEQWLQLPAQVKLEPNDEAIKNKQNGINKKHKNKKRRDNGIQDTILQYKIKTNVTTVQLARTQTKHKQHQHKHATAENKTGDADRRRRWHGVRDGSRQP